MAATIEGLSLQSMDDHTAALIIKLQLEDAENIISSFKGKALEGELSDNELALQLYQEELECNAFIISDQWMTRSIGLDVQMDGNALAECISQEQNAVCDRDMACKLSGSRVLSDVSP